ncbi:MAG TPA: ATP-binding protein [Actinomycetota bacterium]|nr:ATP-binding protein [Actinomycetota bacterium]
MQLRIPPMPEYVSTARLFIGEAGRHFGVAEETLADLKVAISEACTGAIQVQTAEGLEDKISIGVDLTDQGILIEVTSAAGYAPKVSDEWDPATPTELFQKVLGVGVIHALFPAVEFIENPTGLTVRLAISAGQDEDQSVTPP